MAAKVKFSYRPNLTTLYFHITDKNDNYFNTTLAAFEAYNGANATQYRVPLVEVLNSNGKYVGTVPTMLTTSLPIDISIFVFDSATASVSGPIGQGGMRIDKQNNEVNVEQLVAYIFASTVGFTQGVGSNTEHYFSFDTFEAFNTTFDSNGNRATVTLLQELP
jgi:hypothetical protein